MFRSIVYFISGTLLSRFSGLFRDVTLAYVFGTSGALAAFFVAYRLANVMRRLFGEGALLGGFIPHFEEKRKASERDGAIFYRDTLFTIAAMLICVTIVVETVLYCLPSSELLSLTALMFPSILFVCLFALANAILQCSGRFFLSGVSPILFNVVWIIAALMTSDVRSLSLAIVAACILQWLVVGHFAGGSFKGLLTKREWFSPKLFSKDLTAMLIPLGASVLGVGAMQINSAIDVLIARSAAAAGPAYLSYAIRIEQLPLALFGVAISSALLPLLSRHRTERPTDEHAEL